MSEEDRSKSGMTVWIDPNRCVMNAKCTTVAPGVFVIDEETRIAELVDHDASARQLFDAARICPTQAIIIEQFGRRVYPKILPPMFGEGKGS